jgi:hypothetical protein
MKCHHRTDAERQACLEDMQRLYKKLERREGWIRIGGAVGIVCFCTFFALMMWSGYITELNYCLLGLMGIWVGYKLVSRFRP